MRFLATLIAVTALAASAPASAAVLYVADNCTGQPTPCTTDLGSALDDSAYSTVEIVANTTIEGDFLIDRSMVLRGNTGSEIAHPTDSDYALRVESTSDVEVYDLVIDGQLAVYDSVDVELSSLEVYGQDLGVQIVDSVDVLIGFTDIWSDLRGIEARDSDGITVFVGTIDGGRYGIVASDSTVDTWGPSLHGDYFAVVLQEGTSNWIRPIFDGLTTTLTSNLYWEVWRWDTALTYYDDCTPASPSELVSSSGDMAGLIGYTPYGGG